MSQFIPSRKAAEALGLHPNTLRKFADEGKIEFVLTPSGQRRYNIQSFISNRISRDEFNKVNICYCRVSSSKQRDDLEHQANFMRNKYPNYEIILDVGSSLNYKRKGLQRILELACKKELREVVVAYKDRLGRFGYELIQQIIELNGGKLVVLDNRAISKEAELAEDLIRIITFYCNRYYGTRRYKQIGASDTSTQGGSESQIATDAAVKELVRCIKTCVQQNDSANIATSVGISIDAEVRKQTKEAEKTGTSSQSESERIGIELTEVVS